MEGAPGSVMSARTAAADPFCSPLKIANNFSETDNQTFPILSNSTLYPHAIRLKIGERGRYLYFYVFKDTLIQNARPNNTY